jgi:hypothetical protein
MVYILVFIEEFKSKIAEITTQKHCCLRFDAKDIIHREFISEKQSVNGKFYEKVIKRLITQVCPVRPESQESGSWYLLHDNAQPHFWGVVNEFLTKLEILVLSYPSYSPDLAPANLFLFSELEIDVTLRRFDVASLI